jgi:hypothetical protein
LRCATKSKQFANNNSIATINRDANICRNNPGLDR